MGPHLQMSWDIRGSSRAVLGNWAFILSCDGDLWAPLSCLMGVKLSLEFSEGTWDCSRGAAGEMGLISH